MDEQLKIYSVATTANKTDGIVNQVNYMAHVIVVDIGSDKEEAIAIAIEKMKEFSPPGKGWTGYQGMAVEVPATWITQLANQKEVD